MGGSFDDLVKGQLRAELVGDAGPQKHFGKHMNHYEIRLSLETSNRAVKRVTYKLDPTYYDPIRESADLDQNFSVSLTTYGDYPITVEAEVEKQLVRKTVQLSDLLKKTHGESGDPLVKEALRDITQY